MHNKKAEFRMWLCQKSPFS